MKVVILAGGLGTRLREETEFRPKPMVEIGSRPILWHIMKTYAYWGFKDFVICAGYKGEIIKDFFLNYFPRANDFTIELGKRDQIVFHQDHDESDWSVTVADTGADTMTGGRIKAIERHIDDDTFLMTYGDGVCNVNIADTVAFHRSHGKLATVTAIAPPSRFGVLNMDKDGHVNEFVEKPRIEGWVSGGYFVLEREVLNYLHEGDCVFENGPMVKLAEDGQLVGYRHDGFWKAMDTYRESRELNDLWMANKAPWALWRS